MDLKAVVAISIFLVTLIFNAGGFVWLARNHFASVMKKLEEMDARLRNLEIKVAGIKCKHRG